jgi:hypothetical protein
MTVLTPHYFKGVTVGRKPYKRGKVSLREAAKATGRSAKNVRKQLLKAGVDTSAGVELDQVKKLQAERAPLDPGYRGSSPVAGESQRDRRDRLLADAQEIKNKIAMGLLISREEKKAEDDATNEIIRSDFTALPNQLASRLLNLKEMHVAAAVVRDGLIAMVKHWQEAGRVGQEATPE